MSHVYNDLLIWGHSLQKKGYLNALRKASMVVFRFKYEVDVKHVYTENH